MKQAKISILSAGSLTSCKYKLSVAISSLIIPGILLFIVMALAGCTKKSGSTGTPTNDTIFNGSYFQIAFNGKNYYSKDAQVGTKHLVLVLATLTDVGSGTKVLNIQVNSAIGGGLYGISVSSVNFVGSGTNYIVGNSSTGYSNSFITIVNPGVMYTDTLGAATLTHNASDYIAGTFSTTLNNSSFSYPATGSFKIYH